MLIFANLLNLSWTIIRTFVLDAFTTAPKESAGCHCQPILGAACQSFNVGHANGFADHNAMLVEDQIHIFVPRSLQITQIVK